MLAWLAVNAWCVVLLTLGVALVNTQFESVGGWQAGLVLSMAGRTLMNFARVRSLDPPLDGTDFANVASDPDELGAGAAHERRAQLPIRELLFLIVHGERAAGEADPPGFELEELGQRASPLQHALLAKFAFLRASPAPTLIFDARRCVAMWSVGVERALGAAALRSEMRLDELPFASPADETRARGVVDAALAAAESEASSSSSAASGAGAGAAGEDAEEATDGSPVGAGSLDMRLRRGATDPGGARDVVFAFAVSRIGAGADCVVILNGAEVDARLVARLAARDDDRAASDDDDEQRALRIAPSSRDDETESAVSAVSSTSGASLNEQVVLGAELTRGRFATTFSGTWLHRRARAGGRG